MKKVLDFFESLVTNLKDDFQVVTGVLPIYNIPTRKWIDDYNDNDVPFDRVLEDRKKCVTMIREYFDSEENKNQRELVLAMYCNFYIKHGMIGRFEEQGECDDEDGLKELFNSLGIEQQYLRELYNAIKVQNYDSFDRILQINTDSIVAKIYKFVKLCYNYTEDMADVVNIREIDIQKYQELWNLYKSIPEPWKKYVVGDGGLIKESDNPVIQNTLLPYICFKYESSVNWIEGKDILKLKENNFKNMKYLERLCYLHIPVYSRIGLLEFQSLLMRSKEIEESEIQNRKLNKELAKKNEQLQKNATQKKEMMDYYAHSWKHISYPQIVKEIAEELSKTNRTIANRLIKVYNSEKTLQRGIQLLQYISSDDETKVSTEFKNGVAKYGAVTAKTISLDKVISDSLDLVIFKILMVESDDSNSIEKCREKWGKKKSLCDLREEYTQKFLNNIDNNEGLIDWVNDNLITINLEIDEYWKPVRFKDDSFAVNQFKEILVEIFTNVFLHGEKYMKISFLSKDNDDAMVIQEENVCSNIENGSKSGLSTMQRVLEYINIGTSINSLETEVSNDKFKLMIRINKKLLIRKGR